MLVTCPHQSPNVLHEKINSPIYDAAEFSTPTKPNQNEAHTTLTQKAVVALSLKSVLADQDWNNF